MKQSNITRIWNLLYPVCLYFLVTAAAVILLDVILPETVDSKLLRQLLTSFAVLPFLIYQYLQDARLRGNGTGRTYFGRIKIPVVDLICMFGIGGCFAIALNQLLGMFQITQYSASYAQVTQTFYTGRLLLEVTALCIVIPMAEEILYRGIVYQRAADWLGVRTAMVISAVIFGAVHMNLVQFIYASIFGLLLAYFTEVTGNLTGAAAAHMAANLTSVLRAGTNAFDFLDQNPVIRTVSMLGLFLISAAGIFCIVRQERNRRQNDRSQ